MVAESNAATAESDEFTDDVLSPDRCTRGEGGAPYYDDVRDRLGLILHDEVLVDASGYGFECKQWCPVVGISADMASVYPYKVEIPGRGLGLFKAREVLGWRRPIWIHEVINEMAERKDPGGG